MHTSTHALTDRWENEDIARCLTHFLKSEVVRNDGIKFATPKKKNENNSNVQRNMHVKIMVVQVIPSCYLKLSKCIKLLQNKYSVYKEGLYRYMLHTHLIARAFSYLSAQSHQQSFSRLHNPARKYIGQS